MHFAAVIMCIRDPSLKTTALIFTSSETLMPSGFQPDGRYGREKRRRPATGVTQVRAHHAEARLRRQVRRIRQPPSSLPRARWSLVRVQKARTTRDWRHASSHALCRAKKDTSNLLCYCSTCIQDCRVEDSSGGNDQ